MAKLPRDTITHFEYDGKGNINITITDLIRCKDCKHWCLPPCPCVFVDGDFKWISFMEDDGWCSKGELRGDLDGREKI